MTAPAEKMGWNATFAMAVGGMIGGGIFSVLGVVVHLAGPLAWLSFVIAGSVALASAMTYVLLARQFGEGGGAFTFLREINHRGLAGSVSWILIVGYVLTISVYAFTFGHYLAAVVGGGALVQRLAAIVIVASLTLVNLRGVGSSATTEIVSVWGKLFVLAGLAAFGLAQFTPDNLSRGVDSGGFSGAVFGAASVFMAYEGFQLLTYDYDDIKDPERTLWRAVPIAVIVVIGTYVLVALGAASLIGADRLVAQKEIALAAAGKAAMGTAGLVIVSVAAALSTGSAINATLFATARLARRVAADGELPAVFDHHNDRDVPDRAVIILGAAGAVLAVAGSLSSLVEGASLTFLVTFAIVGGIGARVLDRSRWVAVAALVGASLAALALTWRLATTNPLALAAVVGMTLLATAGRHALLQHVRTSS